MGIREWLARRKRKKEETITKTDLSATELKAPTPSPQPKEDLYINIDDVDTTPGSDGTGYRTPDNVQVYTRRGGSYTPVTIVKEPDVKLPSTSVKIPTPSQESLRVQEIPEDINILRRGGVRQGDRTYYGKTVVGDTGKTANQLQRDLREQFTKETGKSIGKGRISGKITHEQVEVTQEVFIKPEPLKNVYFEKPKVKEVVREVLQDWAKKSPANIFFAKDKGEAIKDYTSQQLIAPARFSRTMSYAEAGLKTAIDDLGFKTEIKVPERKFDLITEQYGTQQTNIFTGEKTPFYKSEEIVIPERQRRTAITYLPGAVRAATYFTPAGTALFGSDIVRSVSKVAAPEQEIKFLGYEDTPELREQVKQSGKKELIFEGAVLATGGIIAGTRALKARKVARIEKELTELGRQPIRYIEAIEKPSGRITFEGYQSTPKLERQIFIEGKLGKTEKGFEFIPGAEGTAITTGKVKWLFRKKPLVEIRKFETGSRGTGTQIESLGELTLSQNLGVSTYVPKGTITSFGKVRKSDVVLGGDVLKDIQTSQTIRKGDIGLTLGKDSLGLNILIKEKQIVQDIGKKYFTGTKTPFSKTFADEIAVLKKPRVIQEPPKLDVGRIQEGLSKVDLIKPKPTQAKGIVASVWAGTGLYEKTEGVASAFKPRQELISTQIQPATQLETPQIKTETTFKVQDTRIRTDTKIKAKERLKTFQDVKIEQNIKPILKEELAIKQVTKQRQSLFTPQRFEQLQKIVTEQKFRTKQTPIKITTKIKIPPRPTFLKSLAKKAENGDFEIFEIIKGKTKKTGETKDFITAAKGLGEGLKGGLQASGFITKGGKKIKAKKITSILGSEFRIGKSDAFKVVEKKAKRLRKGGTGKDIQFFR